jgi:nucleotide-binding universal stress UspA family protein
MFHNILVATDGSATAERALAEAIDLAQAYRARLTVIYVVPPTPATTYRVPVNMEQLRGEMEAEGKQILARAVERIPDDVSVTTRLRHGHAGEEILSELDEGGHDLVVLGSRGRGRAKSNLLGSVGGHVHFGTPVAMLVIHPDESAGDGGD